MNESKRLRKDDIRFFMRQGDAQISTDGQATMKKIMLNGQAEQSCMSDQPVRGNGQAEQPCSMKKIERAEQ